MRRRTALRIICWALIIWGAGGVTAAVEPKRVVLLFDERLALPGLAALETNFVGVLTSNFSDTLEVYHEAMDLSRFTSSAYKIRLRDFLTSKYADKKIDVVVAVMGPALDFLLSHGDAIFAGVPIVFCGVDSREISDRLLPPHVGGVLLKRKFKPTVELALRLHPDTQQIVVISGTSEFDMRILADAKEEFRQYEDRLEFTYLTELPLRALLTKVANLPPRTIIMFTTLFQDGARDPFVPHDVVERLSASANAPIYGFLDQYLGRGIVGGSLFSLAQQGPEAAKLTLEVLKADKPSSPFLFRPSSPSLLEPEMNELLFDWRQLQRWGISNKSLPAGSQIRYRPVTAWEQHRWQLASIFVAFLVQSAMVGWLLTERYARRKAELESRQRSLEVIHLNRTAEVGALSASFAHEVSQPLVAISLNAERAKDLLKAAPPEVDKLKEVVTAITQANNLAVDVIRNLRNLLKRKSVIQDCDLNAVIADAVQLLSPEANRRDIELHVNATERALLVRSDPVHLQQVILNLVTNAMDAMNDSAPGARKITIQTTLAAESIGEVSVSDSGSGIPQHMLGEIFDTFYTTKEQGTGLGLSVARTIIETYDGKIWAENQAGGGAVFRFTLPLLKDSGAGSEPFTG